MASKALIKQPRPSNSSSLVSSITNILQSLKPQSRPNQSIHGTPLNFPSLSQYSPHLNPDLVIQVIKTQTSPYQALLFFNWASFPSPNPNNYSHNFHCYISMVDLLLSHRLFTTTADFLESHNKLCDFMIGKLIKTCGDCGNISGALSWFHKAKVFEKGNCIFSCNSLLGVLVKANRVSLAREIFDQVVTEGVVSLNDSTYTVMIKGYCNIGMIEDAQKLFDKMPSRRSLVTYNTIVHGLCRKRMMENARKIVDQMIESKDCLPDLVTYTTLINGYCKIGHMEEAMKCLDEMVKAGFEPNVITYNAIVNGLCWGGKFDEAMRMMTKMRLNGVKDDILTHSSLLRGFCIAGRLQEAVKHLGDMISLGIKPDAKAYGVVVSECCKVGKVNEAISLLRVMRARGKKPFVSSVNAVVKALMERGEHHEAMRLLKQMPDMGCAPNFCSYSTLICRLSKNEGRAQEVAELVRDMLKNGHEPDVSLYSCLTTMYSKCGDLEMAIKTFKDAFGTGHVIGLESFAVFMEELCRKGKIFEARKHFEEMCKRCRVIHLDDYRSILNELISKYSDEKLQDV